MNLSQLSGSPAKAKGTLILIGGIVAIVILAVYLTKTFGGIGKAFRGITDGLGITDSEETAKFKEEVAKAEKAAATAGSPWNANFYKSAPAGSLLLTVAVADKLAAQIWNATGFIFTDAEEILDAIKQCRTKSQVSFLSERFSIKYNKDLYAWMTRQLVLITGQTDPILNNISNYVNSLSDFKV